MKMSNEAGTPNKIVWNCSQIAENAPNWSLESDINLLTHLQAFSEIIFESTQKIDENLKKLSKNLDETSINLHLSRNEFSSLSNTQFIESRVYEEDETILDENQNKPLIEDKNVEQTNNNEDLKVAAKKGLEIISKYYDRINVPIESDSDEDDDEIPGFILQAKDPYINRPLPYVIGTQEWYKTPHVGILDSDSESDEEQISERYSNDSESDNEDKINSGNNSESKTDDEAIVPKEINITEVSFAEQLAEKLGNVISNGDKNENNKNWVIENQNEFCNSEVNKRPIQKVTRDYGKLFSNEPPPMDDDKFFPEKSPKGIFSSGNDLFDDLEDDVGFWGENSIKKLSNNDDTPKKSTQIVDSTKNEEYNKKIIENKKEDLFNDDDDDKLFVPKKSLQVKKDHYKKQSLFDDLTDDEDIFETKIEPKKSLKDDLFDNEEDFNIFNENIESERNDLFGSKEKDVLFESRDNDLFNSKEDFLNNNKNIENKKEDKNAVSNLFSDSDSDDLFYTKPKIFTKKLIHEEKLDKKEIELDRNEVVNKQKEKVKGLFDDDSDEEDKNDLFSGSVANNNDLKKVVMKTENESEEFSKDIVKENLMEVMESESKEVNELEDENSKKDDEIKVIQSNSVEINETPSFFDEPPSIFNEPESIFNDTPSTFNNIPSITNIFDDIPTTKNIFDEPFDETSDETYSYFVNNDEESSKNRFETHQSSIFDDEPPSLFIDTNITLKNQCFDVIPKVDNENYDNKKSVRFEENLEEFEGERVGGVLGVSKGSLDENLINTKEESIKDAEITSPGKLKHNLNINVKALLPGATPAFKSNLSSQKSKSSFDVSSINNLKDENKEKPVVLPRFGLKSEGDNSKIIKNDEEFSSNIEEEQIQVLQSITKSRVRIPVRRRPSTKKGREAIRKSCIEFSTPNNSEIEEEDAQKNDLFNTKTTTTEFESDLFLEQKFKLPKINPNTSKSSLFDDDDDEVFFTNINQSKKDESKVYKSMGESSMIRKAVISSVKKLENVRVTQDDPLNAFER
ncbi:WASH complex subunit 2 [Onthophagus taurus]|uniref:WASH complex subunit 2 n=1 Tax=Onthophagus taurus TaxID=166361 RepID=UPI0039BDFA1E